jgi:hypothetical protein
MGIRDKPIAPASLWQNGFAERLIRSIRRECLDHIFVLGEVHLRRILKNYAAYYTAARPTCCQLDSLDARFWRAMRPFADRHISVKCQNRNSSGTDAMAPGRDWTCKIHLRSCKRALTPVDLFAGSDILRRSRITLAGTTS